MKINTIVRALSFSLAVIMLSMVLLTGCNDEMNSSVDSTTHFAVETLSPETSTIIAETTIDILAEESKKAAEEARLKEEEARLKAEEAKKQVISSSYSMMYYLAITAEEIRTSKDNRIMLDDIYTSLLNDINPSAIDETTQDHLKNLRDIIKEYINISTKRERLNYIYNQNKASAIKSAVPDPISVLSSTKSGMNWKQFAINVAYTITSSYSSYKSTLAAANLEYLTSGWELDDDELATIQKNRDRAFDYMVDMVQKYNLDGLKTLSEKDIEKFAEICDIENTTEKIQRLTAEEKAYDLLGNYWLELAESYFDLSQYEKCLNCVERYEALATNIYRKDSNYAQILTKAIVAAQNVYTDDKYISTIEKYNKALIDNTSTDDWSLRYFAAQIYLDLYAKTNSNIYLQAAYDIAKSNVTVLLDEQRELNSTYLNDVVEIVAEEPDYNYMTADEKKEAEAEYKAEKKRVKEYNKELEETRETEVPTLYAPLVLNCELLFALAEKLDISEEEKDNIEAILQTDSNGIFLVSPLNDAYSFSTTTKEYNAGMTKKEIVIPASLLTSDSTVTITIEDSNNSVVCTDCEITEVEREGSTIDTFYAHIESDTMQNFKWSLNATANVKITYNDAYDKTLTLSFVVSEFSENWLFPDTVVFTQK